MTDDPDRRLRHSVLRLIGAILAIVVIGLVAGYAFGRTDARRAAALLVDDFVADEPIGEATQGPAPSSGDVSEAVAVVCDVRTSSLSLEQQIAALRAGVVVVQYRDDDLGQQVAAWAEGRTGVVIAGNDALDQAIVATAWGRRLSITHVNEQLLSAFVTAFGDAGPAPRACGL